VILAMDFLNEIAVKKSDFVIDGNPYRLAGNHTWNTVQPMAGEVISLNKLTGNFTRLWTVETRGMLLQNTFYGTNSPGLVKVDDVPWKKNGSLNQGYYDRLEKVVKKAKRKDIVTGVVLFDHAFNAYFPQGWENHPFNGLKDGPKSVEYIHTKGPWNQYQRAHVKKVVKTLDPYNNVIYEVGNELHRYSVSWFQKKVISWAKKWTDKPVGASYASRVKPSAGRTQDWLTRVGADWIAPSGAFKISGFRGPQVLDTDHAWALTSNVAGLRRAWSEGRNLWVMDGLTGTILKNRDNLQPDRDLITGLIS
jgi:hypothetical protein